MLSQMMKIVQTLTILGPSKSAALGLSLFSLMVNPRLPVGLFQLRFPAWPNVLATQFVYNLFFLSNFLLGYAINVYNQRGFS